MPITDSIASKASAAYSSALSVASDNYDNARSAVSAQISGEPKPAHEALFSSAQAAYSDSIEAASSGLQAAVSAASTAIYGAPPGALESMSSVAQSRLQEGLSAASSRYSDAKSYVAAVNTGAPQKQKMLQQMQEQYYAGIGMAHAHYSEFLEAASSAVMPKPTPFHESLYSKASAGVLGTPTPGYEDALSTAQSAYSGAVAGASSQLDQLLSSIKSVGGAQKDLVATGVASSRYSSALAEASSSYANISSAIAEKVKDKASDASNVIYGSETPFTESVASAASENWEALITKASNQIYAQPTPYFVTQRLVSEALEYGAAATDAATNQYHVVQSIISELVVGK